MKIVLAISLLLACAASSAFSHHGLLAEVWRDLTGHYVANLIIGSPPKPKLFLLDIAQNLISVGQCPAKAPKPAIAETFTFNSTDGANPGRHEVQVKGIKVLCRSSLPKASAYGGVVGLGPGESSLPSQLAAHLHLPRRFAYCLSGDTHQIPTPLFFASSNYTFMPGKQLDLSQHAPLLKPTKKKPGYRVGLQAIKVGDTTLSINPKVFKGGLEISTTEPYTKLVRPAYLALVNAFRQAESGIKRVPASAPFDTCFNATGVGSTRVGPPVNTISFVLGHNSTEWPFFGYSSMVFVSEEVMCLGFLDAGPLPAHSVLGTFQQEDSLVELDLDKKTLGFYSTLPFIETVCADFNFTRGSF